MSSPESRWGSDRSRQLIVTVVMIGILLIALGVASAFVQQRSKSSSTGMIERVTIPKLGINARKIRHS